jgi:4-amino-4-deoxy-L-arabinose transferase-like glycosyltransferase
VIARRLWDWRVGAVAGLFLAFSPLHHEWSQIGRTDAPATLLVLVAVYCCLRLVEQPAWPAYLGAGLAIGLASATKFNSVVLLLVMVLAHLLSTRRAWRYLAWGVIGVVAGFALGAPYVLLDWRTALPQMLFENRGSHPGADRLPGLLNYWWYASDAIPKGLSWPVAALALAGLVWQGALVARTAGQRWFGQARDVSGEVRHARSVAVLLAFPAAYLLLIGIASLRWAHWVVPLMPFGAILAASALVGLVDRLRIGAAARGWLLAGTSLLIILPAAFGIVRSDAQISGKNTQTLAQEWFAANVPDGAVVGSEWYTGMYWSQTIQLVEEPSLALQPVQRFRDAGAQYLVASSDVYDRFFKEPARYPEVVRAYQEIFDTLPLVQEFRPDPWRHPGPTIKVFRLE